jgi:hypothetical protein
MFTPRMLLQCVENYLRLVLEHYLLTAPSRNHIVQVLAMQG